MAISDVFSAIVDIFRIYFGRFCAISDVFFGFFDAFVTYFDNSWAILTVFSAILTCFRRANLGQDLHIDVPSLGQELHSDVHAWPRLAFY